MQENINCSVSCVYTDPDILISIEAEMIVQLGLQNNREIKKDKNFHDDGVMIALKNDKVEADVEAISRS